MFRSLMLVAAVAITLSPYPAGSEEAPAISGRFLLSSDNDSGFVRLDTRTGAVSHCGQREGTWVCEPVADPAAADQIARLGEHIARLSAGLDRLSGRVDELAARVPVAKAEDAPLGAEGDGAVGQPGFARVVLQKFLNMVRAMKHPPADQG